MRVARRLADVDALGIAAREIEHFGRNQPVVQHDIGILQRSQRAQRQQARIARTGADQRDFALRTSAALREARRASRRCARATLELRRIFAAREHVGGERAVEEVFPEAAARAGVSRCAP